MKLSVTLISVLAAVIVAVTGYGTGAPDRACEGLAPIHAGILPQETLAPYTITINDTEWMSNGALSVMLSGGDVNGFILQARTKSKQPAGFFDSQYLPSMTKAGPCMAKSEATSVTHTSPETKTDLKFIWIAPDKSEVSETIFFQASVATGHETYWTDIVSSDILFKATTTQTIGGGDDGNSNNNVQDNQSTEDPRSSADRHTATVVFVISSLLTLCPVLF